jgi:formamidopyrimidine-DNA glycosylase
MPELPEVEWLRKSLERSLVGRRFVQVNVSLPKLFVGLDGLTTEDLVGRRVEALRRRAKFLIFELSEALALVAHLRMSGQMIHRAADGRTLATGGHPVPAFDAPLPHKATHAIFRLDDGSLLYLTDIRQFGRLWLMRSATVEAFLAQARLGPEPLGESFSLDEFRQRLGRRPRAALKPLLLDQRFLGGVGNIYADEIAFEAGLSPLQVAGELDQAGQANLYRAIRQVLEHAVTNGVAEILNGRANPERDFPRVHGRSGQPCPRCGTTVVKTRVGGRGTYYCPRCQAWPPADIAQSGAALRLRGVERPCPGSATGE